MKEQKSANYNEGVAHENRSITIIVHSYSGDVVYEIQRNLIAISTLDCILIEIIPYLTKISTKQCKQCK